MNINTILIKKQMNTEGKGLHHMLLVEQVRVE